MEKFLLSRTVKILYSYTNLSIGILNNDGYNKVVSIWKNIYPINKVNTLKKIIEEIEISRSNIFEWEKYFDCFYPNIKIDGKARNFELNKTLIDAIWLLPPCRLPNYYKTIKKNFPVVDILWSINVIKQLYKISQSNSEEPVLFETATGLYFLRKEIKNSTHNGLLYNKSIVIGCTFIHEKISKTNKNEHYLKIDLEKHALGKLLELKTEDESAALNFEDNNYLLNQLSKKIICNKNILNYYLNLSEYVISKSINFMDQVTTLHPHVYGAEWRRLNLLLIFIYIFNKYNMIEETYLTCIKEYHESKSGFIKSIKDKIILFITNWLNPIQKYNFNLKIPLSPIKKIDRALSLQCTLMISSGLPNVAFETENIELIENRQKVKEPFEIDLINNQVISGTTTLINEFNNF